MKGEVTKRSFRNDHLDFGSEEFQISENHTVMSGALGRESFEA